MTPTVALLAATPAFAEAAKRLAEQYQLADSPQPEAEFVLYLDDDGLALHWLSMPKMTPLRVNLGEGKSGFRARQASIKDEAIARAVGLGKGQRPRVLDATAGLGRDAFLLASMGCQVALSERHAVVAALLQDGLARAARRVDWLPERLYFAASDSLFSGAGLRSDIDVVYLDPMYPKAAGSKQRAAVKKDMQMFQQLVGADSDADALLEPALAMAQQRVVVKRPQHADWLAGLKPNSQIISKKHRFDVYLR